MRLVASIAASVLGGYSGDFAFAQDNTVTKHSYDALGRLVESKTTCPGREVTTSTQFDKAGNRVRYVTQGAPGCGRRNVMVLPLHGFSITPI